MSKERKELGLRAEQRVIKKMGSSVITIEDRSRIYPDFSFELMGGVGDSYAVEVKTMKGVYEGEKVGMIGISKEEFNAYEELSKRYMVLVVVEIRPRGYHWSKYLHYIVEWISIRDRYYETKPNNLRLSLWWVLSNGTKLEDWIKLVYS